MIIINQTDNHFRLSDWYLQIKHVSYPLCWLNLNSSWKYDRFLYTVENYLLQGTVLLNITDESFVRIYICKQSIRNLFSILWTLHFFLPAVSLKGSCEPRICFSDWDQTKKQASVKVNYCSYFHIAKLINTVYSKGHR